MHDYYKTKMVRMGRWALMPLDSGNWHTIHTTNYFYKAFGIYKGTLTLHEVDTGHQYCYFPQYYFDSLYKYITDINKKDYKALSKVFNKFYKSKVKAKKEIPIITQGKNLKQISNQELIKLFVKNRDWAHFITIYDQFAWTAEDYWEPHMEDILVNKLGIAKESPEYNKVLFILTKPEEISTTLEEKRDVLLEAWRIKTKNKNLKQAARLLAKKYGWMPVFTFGDPWDQNYYLSQLENLTKIRADKLLKEYKELKDYSKLQRANIKKVVDEYSISPRDLQLFIDFGLALDTRNEAEYIVSLAGFHVRPIYEEIAKRLFISLNQLRRLDQGQIISCLQNKSNVQQVLHSQGKVVGWGFNHEMNKQINFSPSEAEKLLKYLEKKSFNLHGHDESKGKCASPGKVTGKVKIVLSPTENNKVNDGDILVCEATTVDYLPAMKKAAAFVTEVGSLTCHAAVVAREFGVPCIVSLKNATKNFKDGDKVELNADLGIMKKI